MDLATAAHRAPARLQPRGHAAAASTPGPELSIIVPTFNERDNISELLGRLRASLSHAATDPMSGFFMMRREVFTDAQRRLSSLGFKILTDLFASCPRPLRFRELSYSFGVRHAGESKFDSASAWDYAMLVLDKLVGRWVPVRFLAFSIVGSLGVVVHFAVLSLCFAVLKNTFLASQGVAIAAAMTFNFAVNNLLTYRDRRLRGLKWVRGWVTFLLACSVGALMNLGLAGSLYRADHAWPLAALGGIVVGAIWNYVATTFLTWGRPRA
jgi:dolichol-phosphate mannosyltransferase